MNALAARIVTAFMEPALAATDWRVKWRGVNRAAGVVVGWALAVTRFHAPVEAETVIAAVESLFNGDPAHVQLTDGLRKRVAEILVLMGN